MKAGGFRVLERRGNGRLDVASWHSPHSLTWAWLLSLSWSTPGYVPPAFQWADVGPHRFRGVSIGSLINAHAMRDNNGWQWRLTLLGLGVQWAQQRPMWFRDLYWSRENAKYERRAA